MWLDYKLTLEHIVFIFGANFRVAILYIRRQYTNLF
jgi:hypothetical protein